MAAATKPNKADPVAMGDFQRRAETENFRNIDKIDRQQNQSHTVFEGRQTGFDRGRPSAMAAAAKAETQTGGVTLGQTGRVEDHQVGRQNFPRPRSPARARPPPTKMM